MLPWKTIASTATKEGELQLRQRGPKEFWITINGRVLMTSTDHKSEDAVATLACKEIATAKRPRVLIGGLGLAFTLRAALDALPKDAEVTVAELTPEIEEWCRGPLASLTDDAVSDPRVRVDIEDVSRSIAKARAGTYDAIILDLYEGPHGVMKREHAPLYGPQALARTHAALAPSGVLAIWSEDASTAFQKKMENAGFKTTIHRPQRSYGVYLGRRVAPRTSAPRRRA